MATKPCTITEWQKAASDKAAINALDGALATGAASILARMAERSHRVTRAWLKAGGRTNRTAIDRIAREVDRP